MKKIMAASILLALLSTGCSKGIEKPHEFQVKEIVQVKMEDGTIASAAHCKKSLSLFNYYIVVPVHEIPVSSEGAIPKFDYSVLFAIEGDKAEFKLTSDDSKVTDHGYKFSYWKEAAK